MLKVFVNQYLIGIVIYDSNLPNLCRGHFGFYVEADPSLASTFNPFKELLHKRG